jgi:hypothetical protein
MAEDHWGEAITDEVGRTPESDAAVDTDEERVQLHRQQASDLQSVISRVAQAHMGDGRGVILANLRRELEAHGHWPQPKPWLEAVAEEMQSGRHYQVGTD